jgi:ABC-2 type transport system permease protein
VGDIDLMHSEFLRVRAQPNMSDIDWQFDNVTFVLNVIDQLANDDRFLDIRKRRTRHSTLRLVEEKAAQKREDAEKEIDEFSSEFEEAEKDARQAQEQALAELQKRVEDLQAKARESGGDLTGREAQRALQAALQQVALKETVERRKFETKVERRKRERDRKLRMIERELDTEIQQTQNLYKGMALFLPMLPPVLIGLAVFVRRQRLESEGITSERRC